MAYHLPHVIYIFSDEHRGQAMSHMGDPNVQTPNLDQLATAGASFTRAYANCPICTPSRGTVFSGRHAHAGPVSGFFDVYKATAPSTATILRQAGYHTAYFGKWHCGIVRDQLTSKMRDRFKHYGGSIQRTPERHRAGFQDWFGFENLNQHFDSYYYAGRDLEPTRCSGYETDGLFDLASEYLKKYGRQQPLFLVLSVTPPHFPLLVPEQFKRFSPQTMQVRPNFGRRDPFFTTVADETETRLRENLALYYAMIENLDWNIGLLCQTLAGLPHLRDTLLVYFSDHGEYMGSHGLQCAKETHHEESVRIPAIFHWPGHIPPQGAIPGLFSLVDLLPTTLGLLGLELPPHLQGRDFSPALRGERFVGPKAVLLEMVNNPRWNLRFLDWRGLVTERWKYAFYETGQEVLFDLAADPYEMNDLAPRAPQLLQEMRQNLLRILRETREPYFDVLIEYGVNMNAPTLDASKH